MHQVISATTNPAKIQAILQAFEEISAKDRAILRPSPSRAAYRSSPSEARKRVLAHEIAWIMRDACIHKLISG